MRTLSEAALDVLNDLVVLNVVHDGTKLVGGIEARTDLNLLGDLDELVEHGVLKKQHNVEQRSTKRATLDITLEINGENSAHLHGTLLDEKARGSGAYLASVEVDADSDPIDNSIDISVVEDDDRRLTWHRETLSTKEKETYQMMHTSKLERALLHLAGSLESDLGTSGNGASEGNLGDERMLDQGRASSGAEASDDVEHTIGGGNMSMEKDRDVAKQDG